MVQIALFRDFGQLPPVIDVALYSQHELPQLLKWPHASIETLNPFGKHSNQLSKCGNRVSMRWMWGLEMHSSWLISFRSVMSEDWQFFQTLVLSSMTIERQREFIDVIVLFTTNSEVLEHNITMLESSGKPIA